MPKIVISTEVAGFVPERTLLCGLFVAHPEAFDEPFALTDFGFASNASEAEVAEQIPSAILVDGQLRFLRSDCAIRALPWLVEEVQRRQGQNCTCYGGTAKVVEIPDDVAWYLYEAEDGRESIHEQHRVWN
jgi:hypothetical protein